MRVSKAAVSLTRRHQSSGRILAFDQYKPKQRTVKQPFSDDWFDTIVFMHGILGSRRNWRTPANLFIRNNPGFQAFGVDHRGHGGSRFVGEGSSSTVSACADDLDALLHSKDVGSSLLLATPDILVAHSFGGKVALAHLTARQARGEPIPRHTWILDSLPGPYVEKRLADGKHSVNSVAGIFEALNSESLFFPSSKAAVDMLLKRGVALPVAQWLATGCFVPDGPDNPNKWVTWGFDLKTATALFSDFCRLDVWPWLDAFDGRGASKEGRDACVHYVRAGKNQMWTEQDVTRLQALSESGRGVAYHCMEHVGHWMHVDDCEGLITLISEKSS